MLERFDVVNFQVVARRTVEFDPGVTTLIGPTDTGKSSTVRALTWTATNQPSLEAWTRMNPIRHGADFCRGSLVLDGGRSVTRRRGKRGNEYVLDGRVLRLDRGTEVPAEVVALLNLSRASFQPQHDPSFWFGEGGSAVGRAINALVDLGEIDRTLDAVAARVRREKAAEAMATARLAQARDRRDALAWVEHADRALRRLEYAYAEVERKRHRYARLSVLLETIREAEADRDLAAYAGHGVVVALRAAEKAADLLARTTMLRELLVKLKEAVRASARKPPALDDLEAAILRHHHAKDLWARLKVLLVKLSAARRRTAEARRACALAAANLKEAEASLDRCPLCGAPRG